MYDRHKEIINILKEKNNYVTGKELAAILKVTDRTIRNDINEINAINDNIIVSSKKRGYMLTKMPIYNDKVNNIPQNRLERGQYILKKLLFADNNSIKKNNLITEICISDYSLNKDIRELNLELSKYHSLTIIQKNNYIILSGENLNKKLLLKKLIKLEVKNNFANMSSISKMFPHFDLISFKNIFIQLLKDNHYQINESYIPVIMLHIGVVINFMDNSFLSDKINLDHYHFNSLEEEIVYQFFKKISYEIHINISYDDIKTISHLLKSAKTHDQLVLIKSNNVIQTLISDICNALKKIFGADLKNDEVFINSIYLHLNSIMNRQIKEKSIENVYLADIKNKFPLLFEMGMSVKDIISKTLKCNLSEDEIGFLCLHIGAAYDRYIQNNNKLRVILIIPFENSIVKNCIKKINQSFESKLTVIKAISYLDEPSINYLNIDFIITTVSLQLSSKINIPIIEISTFVTSEDEYKIHKVILEFEQNQNYELINYLKHNYIKKELFYPHLSAKNPEEIIKIMVSYLEELKYVDGKYIDTVLEREKASHTSFHCGFAIPHSIYFNAKKTAISIAILNEPMNWGAYTVKIVILLAVSEEDKDIFRIFIDFLGKIFNNSISSAKLLNSTNYEDFINNLI